MSQLKSSRRQSEATVATTPENDKRESLKRTNTSLSKLPQKNSRMFAESVEQSVLDSISPVELKRQQVVHEIFLTEKQYINDLKLTIRVRR